MNIKTLYFFITASVLIFVGTFLPWISFFGLTANGTATNDGKIMVGLSIVIAACAFLWVDNHVWARIVVTLCCLCAIILAVFNLVDIMSYSPDADGILSGVRPQTGLGLWTILLGGCVGIVGSVRVYYKKLVVPSDSQIAMDDYLNH